MVEVKRLGNLIDAYTVLLVGVKLEERKRLIKLWHSSGFGFKEQLSDYSFRHLIKMAVNGELK